MSFGNRLREARANKGLSQKKLAEMVGVANTAISNYEKDISFPNTSILYKLFSALDCDANFLFQDEVEKCKTTMSISSNEQKILNAYKMLNENGKKKLLEYLVDLTENPKYTEKHKTVSDDIIEELKQDIARSRINIK